MSQSDETKQFMAAAKAALNIMFNRLVETLEKAETNLNTSANSIATIESITVVRKAVQEVSGVVGHLHLTDEEALYRRDCFIDAIDKFNKCLRYPTEFWDEPEWLENFRTMSNVVEDALEKLRVVAMPEELYLLKVGITQGLGMRLGAFDRDLYINPDQATKEQKEQQKEAPKPAEPTKSRYTQ